MKDFVPVIIVFVLLVIGGVFFITRSSDNTSQEASEARTVVSEQNAVDDAVVLNIGDPAAPATLVEYFDYKCPACNQFHRSTAKEIEEAYITTGDANFEIRITPVIGPDSANAGRGAYCANEQGVFSEYHNTILDYMYDNFYASGNFASEFENILTTSLLTELATPLGIDTAQFSSCVDSDRYNSNLDANLNAAADDGVRGTPGFAVGSQSFVGGQPFSVFRTLLDIELGR